MLPRRRPAPAPSRNRAAPGRPPPAAGGGGGRGPPPGARDAGGRPLFTLMPYPQLCRAECRNPVKQAPATAGARHHQSMGSCLKGVVETVARRAEFHPERRQRGTAIEYDNPELDAARGPPGHAGLCGRTGNPRHLTPRVSPVRPLRLRLVSLSPLLHTVLQGGPAWTGRSCSRHWA